MLGDLQEPGCFNVGALSSALGMWGVVPLGHQLLFTWQATPTPVHLAIIYEVIMGVCYLMVRLHPFRLERTVVTARQCRLRLLCPYWRVEKALNAFSESKDVD